MKATVVIPFHLDDGQLVSVGTVFEGEQAQRIVDHDVWHRHVSVTDRTPYVAAPTDSQPPTKQSFSGVTAITPAITQPASAKEQ